MSDCEDVSTDKNETSESDKTANAEKKVGFQRPTLKIPLERSYDRNPYSAHLSNNVPNERKKSQYVFDQFNDFRHLTMNRAKSQLGRGEKAAYLMYGKVKKWSRKWFTHLFLTIVLIVYTIGGALSFTAIESPHEEELRLIDLRESRKNLMHDIGDLLVKSLEWDNTTTIEKWLEKSTPLILDYSNDILDHHKTKKFLENNQNQTKMWTFLNSVVYCSTIYTTIGYGHMFPKTTTGRVLTIVYALIGIPLFLIALTDFGKLFTRWIKFLWSFVRRFYHTKSCKRMRRRSVVEAHNIYDMLWKQEKGIDTSNAEGQDVETPTSPAISAFEIDDEFNLPISVALFILISYIFCGAVLYMFFEGWNFFESFYFVFVSMTTIGFGDYVPKKPGTMIGSIVYLVFGLALMSMCINVVQLKLSDTFKKASAKIGATMGLQINENGSVTLTPEKVESQTFNAPVN